MNLKSEIKSERNKTFDRTVQLCFGTASNRRRRRNKLSMEQCDKSPKDNSNNDSSKMQHPGMSPRVGRSPVAHLKIGSDL